MNLEEQAFVIIGNLLLEVKGLPPEVESIITKEFLELITNEEYRKKCSKLDILRFYDFGYKSLHSILTGSIIWAHTHTEHKFWVNLYDYLTRIHY